MKKKNYKEGDLIIDQRKTHAYEQTDLYRTDVKGSMAVGKGRNQYYSDYSDYHCCNSHSGNFQESAYRSCKQTVFKDKFVY